MAQHTWCKDPDLIDWTMPQATKHRLFVAVVPPPAAREHLRETLAALPEPLRQDPDLRWTAPERWHITLAFLGQVPGPLLTRLRQELAPAVADVAPLPPLALRGAGHFGRTAAWIGVGPADTSQAQSDHLRRLARSVRRACRAARCPPDDDQWRAHLTIARTRRGATASMLSVLSRHLVDYAGPPWRAAEVMLVESFLGPSPQHVPVAAWPLPGPPTPSHPTARG